MRQVATGLECDLRRRGYNVSASREEPRESTDDRWRYQWSSTYHISVTSGSLSTDIRFFNMFRPEPGALADILNTYSIDVLVFDHGLHYMVPYESGSFVNDTGRALELLAANVPLLSWKETSTQHYETLGGHFSYRAIEEGTSCVPVPKDGFDSPRSMSITNWMSDLMRDMQWTLLSTAGQSDFMSAPSTPGKQELVMIPFRSFTSSLWEMHPAFPDCTHFCSTPFLWLPIWRSLRVAIDRAIQNNDFYSRK